MSARRRSLSDGDRATTSSAERELVRHLQAQLERSGELGRGLLLKVDELTTTKSQLEEQVNTLLRNNQQMTAELGKARSEKRSLSMLCNSVLESNQEKDMVTDELVVEKDRLQRYFEARAARGRLNSEPVLATPRDIRLTPRVTPRVQRREKEKEKVELVALEHTIVSLPSSDGGNNRQASVCSAPAMYNNVTIRPVQSTSAFSEGSMDSAPIEFLEEARQSMASVPGEALSDLLGMAGAANFGLDTARCDSSKSPSPPPEALARMHSPAAAQQPRRKVEVVPHPGVADPLAGVSASTSPSPPADGSAVGPSPQARTPSELVVDASPSQRRTPLSSVPRLPIRSANIAVKPRRGAPEGVRDAESNSSSDGEGDGNAGVAANGGAAAPGAVGVSSEVVEVRARALTLAPAQMGGDAVGAADGDGDGEGAEALRPPSLPPVPASPSAGRAQAGVSVGVSISIPQPSSPSAPTGSPPQSPATPTPKKKRSIANLLGLTPRRLSQKRGGSAAGAHASSYDLLQRVGDANESGMLPHSPTSPKGGRMPFASTPVSPSKAVVQWGSTDRSGRPVKEKNKKKKKKGGVCDSDESGSEDDDVLRTPEASASAGMIRVDSREVLTGDGGAAASPRAGIAGANGSFPTGLLATPSDGDASPPAKRTMTDALRSWAQGAARHVDSAAPTIPVDAVSRKLTEASLPTPTLDELVAIAREEEARREQENLCEVNTRSAATTPGFDTRTGAGESAAPRPAGDDPGCHHSTMYHLRQILKVLQRDLRENMSGGDAGAGATPPTPSTGRTFTELRKMEKEIAVLLDRLLGPSTTFFMEIVIRDYQQLRTLEGELHVFLHELSKDVSVGPQLRDAERAGHDRYVQAKIDKIRYQSALIRQQKVVIRQKRHILHSRQLRLFYAHLCKCLSATLMVLRILKFYPINVNAVPRGSRRFLEHLYEMLPHSVVLFEAGQSLAHAPGPKGRYNTFSLADIDSFVDAVGLSLCRRHEQQLSLLTADEDAVVSGCVDAADWIVGVVVEAIRQGRPNPVFPIADQIIAWTSGRRLVFEDQASERPTPRRRRAYTLSEAIQPLPDSEAVGWRMPEDGLVTMVPASDHLGWSAEGIFRYTGVRTMSGDLWGIEECDREYSYHHYGFATDTTGAARDRNMTQVSSLLWGTHPNQVWCDDTEFLALNPILETLSSPVTYTLLYVSSAAGGLSPGGVLEYTMHGEEQPSLMKNKQQSWSSRTGVVHANPRLSKGRKR